MPTAVPNHKVKTVAKSPVFGWFRFTVGATGAVGTLRQAKSNHIKSVTRTGVGLYTVEFNRPYPLNLVDISPKINRLLPGTALLALEYDFTTGLVAATGSTGTTFKLFVSGATNATTNTQIVTEAVTGTEIMVSYVYQDINNLKD